MWRKLKSSKFYMSFLYGVNTLEVHVTDYVTLWSGYFAKTTYLAMLKACNRLLEMSNEALLQKGLQFFMHPDKLKSIDSKLVGTSLEITMTMMFGYPFKLTLDLNEASSEMFFRKVTQPLLTTVLELKNSQRELCQLLKKKDSEIEEYKCEGGEIALKHLKTKPFNEEEVLSRYRSFQDHFGPTDDLISELIEKVLETPEDNVKKEVIDESTELEPPIIKIEHSSNSNSNCRTSNFNVEPMSQTIPVKVESSTPSGIIKTEPNSQNALKIEPSSQNSESQSVSSVNGTLNVKQDPGFSIKREESQTMPINRKRLKKLF